MKPRMLRMGLVGLVVVSIGLAWWSCDQWTTEAIVTWVEGLGVWGPLVFMGVYCLAPALFFPGAVLTSSHLRELGLQQVLTWRERPWLGTPRGSVSGVIAFLAGRLTISPPPVGGPRPPGVPATSPATAPTVLRQAFPCRLVRSR